MRLSNLLCFICLRVAIVSSLAQIGHIILILCEVYSDRAVIQLGGFSIQDATSCELSYRANTSEFQNLINNYMPTDNTIELTNLKPSTFYMVYMVCHVRSQRVSSLHLNLTTRSSGSVNLCPATQTTPRLEVTSTSHPEVLKEKMNLTSSPLELVLSIIFVVMATVILSTTAYYLIKKYNRRRRIRRFLNYRQQENDPFPNLEETS